MHRWLLSGVFTGLAALALAIAAGSAPATAQSSPCEFTGAERVVAIGDVHGAYERFTEIMRTAGVIDADSHWVGGKAHLVQLGDLDDRGAGSRKALDLMRRLEGEASKAGGQVHALLGNHEIMRMLGDLRYVTPEEYQTFVTADSERVRKNFVSRTQPDATDEIVNKTPLGWVELIIAFGPNGEYGRWLRTLNTIVKIDGIEFLHGGISPEVADMSCETINDTVRRELTSDFDKTAADAVHSLAAGEGGPLWYRGLAQEPDTFAPQVTDILARQKARAIVVGHTVTPTPRIRQRFDGRVIQIDTGMQPAYVTGGRASALEIRGGVFTAIYVDRRDPLASPATP